MAVDTTVIAPATAPAETPATTSTTAHPAPTGSLGALSASDMAAMLRIALLIVGVVLVLVVGTMCWVVIRDGSNPLVSQSMDELKQTVVACWVCLAAMFGVHGLLAKVLGGGAS